MIIPERSATAEATPILWASNSVASVELEFISRGVGTNCSTTEPVIKLTTAKVPERRSSRTADTLTRLLPKNNVSLVLGLFTFFSHYVAQFVCAKAKEGRYL